MPTLANTLAATATLSAVSVLALPMLGLARANTASQQGIFHARLVARGIEWHATDTGHYAPAFRTNPDGTITHHSAMLLAGGYVASEADFTSPLAPGGGAPSAGSHAMQARRLAFTVNGAIMPPEPLQYSGTDRHYRPVAHRGTAPQSAHRLMHQGEPMAPATTLLVTEWLATQWLATDGYAALRQGERILSHRPIVPFLGESAGRSPEREPVAGASATPFRYPAAGDIFPDNAPFAEALTSHGPTEINAMGRSHAGHRAAMVMLDGSARLATPRESVEQRLWGRAFHSITGGRGVGGVGG